ncbi:arylsulfatase B-like [Apostichopus japonicus]|uniref:arylsulfatase B-like n=1 Tax=Stichopus japonicus TaxID=307972 RepID=UPI003AB641CE
MKGNMNLPLILVVTVSLAPLVQSTNPRPHVIIMLADDLAFGDVSYHSNETNGAIETPNIDALADAGIKFENYYVQPTCTPTRSQLMTARYQIHTGLMHGVIQPPQPSCIPLDEKLLPEYMKDYGYSTHMVGKWHLGMYKPACRPTNRGFDSHYGILLGAGGYYSHTSSYYMKAEDVTFTGKDYRYTYSGVTDDEIQEEYDQNYTTTLYIDRAKEIIDTYSGTSNSDISPLFLYVAFQTPHKPIEVPNSFVQPYNGGPLTGTRKQYAGLVGSLDYAVGEIVQKLKDVGIYDESIIIFSTDNGGADQPSSNWPLRGAKHTLWEGGIRGVGFVTSPNFIPNCNVGSVKHDLVHVSDWLPTIVEGALQETVTPPTNKSLDGVNVWNYISKCKVKRTLRRELLHNIDPFYLQGRIKDSDYVNGVLQTPATFDTSIHAALRVGDMKIMTGEQGSMDRTPPPESGLATPVETLNQTQSVRLFNIADDPYEETDLSTTADPALFQSMLDKLADYWESSDRVAILYPQYETEADPETDGYWRPWRNDDESLI